MLAGGCGPSPPRQAAPEDTRAAGRDLTASELAAPPPSHRRGPASPAALASRAGSLLPPGLVKERAVFRLFFKYKPPSLIQQCLWGSCCVPGCVPLKPRSCRGRQGPCRLGPHTSWGRQRNGTRPGSAQWRVGAGQRDGGWPVASLGGYGRPLWRFNAEAWGSWARGGHGAGGPLGVSEELHGGPRGRRVEVNQRTELGLERGRSG